MADRIDAAKAAARLGVKPATLYSYVSRGLLTSARDASGRRSLFDPVEVDHLRRRAHPLRAPGAEIVIESAITALGADRPFFRGRDALTLAGSWTFEQTAEWLWNGVVPDRSPVWQPLPAAVAAARDVQQLLPPSTLPLDRVMLAVTVLAVSDPMRHTVDPTAVAATGRALIAGMVDALPTQRARAGRPAERVAERLWPRLTKASPHPALVPCLEAALVLLADHELAASTMAARIAASVKADPYAVVSSALGVVAGPMHGGASLGAERMLAEIAEPGDAARVIGERLRRGERIPGVGHAVYKSGDRRADRLMELLRDATPNHPRLAVSDAVLQELHLRGLPAANSDFAIATLGQVCGMVPGAGEAIFAVARTAGWLAHALEEYTRTSPLRPRAVYVGTPIDADASTSSSESS
jgi:citrate synthase